MPTITLRTTFAAAVVTGGLALAGPVAAAHLPEPTTEIEGGQVVMVLDETETSTRFIPEGGEPTEEFPEEQPAVGDAFAFTDDLHQDGVLVGSDEGRCTVQPGNAIVCAATFTLARGSITASGPVDEGEDENAPSTIPITSGTGDYAGIRGTLTIVDLTDEADPTDTRSTLTFRYLLPAQATQVSAVPVGAAATGGGAAGTDTDTVLLIAVGIAAVVGSGGLFAAAHAAGRRN